MDGGGEREGDFPPEGRYRYYILTQEEAAAGATTAAGSGGGGGAGGADGGEDDGAGGGRLKERYHFVIIGEGTAADAAMESILRMQPEAEILCLSDETVREWMRLCCVVMCCVASLFARAGLLCTCAKRSRAPSRGCLFLLRCTSVGGWCEAQVCLGAPMIGGREG